MTWNSSALSLALCALLAACQVPDADRTAEVTAQEIQKSAKPVAVVSREERGVASKLEGILKKDMAYADLRSVVLADGWSPQATAECKKNVGGEALICDQLPELESCSGDGYCISHFQNASGERLDVTSYGMFEDWNVSGEDSRFNVVEWSFAKASGS